MQTITYEEYNRKKTEITALYEEVLKHAQTKIEELDFLLCVLMLKDLVEFEEEIDSLVKI